MVHVFYRKRGSGKTKDLINLANEKIDTCKGDVVFIDKGDRHILDLNSKIRFVSTDQFDLESFSSLYGFICGMISEDFDICTICIDNVENAVNQNEEGETHFLNKLRKLAQQMNIEIYLNIDSEGEAISNYYKNA